MEERTITITKDKLAEASAEACRRITDVADKKGLDAKACTLFVLFSAILYSEITKVLFPKENDPEEKLAESIVGDAK